MNGDPDDRELFTDLVYFDRDAVESNIPSVLNQSMYWDDCSPEYSDLDEESPVIFGDFTLGLKGDPFARLLVDTMGSTANLILPKASTEREHQATSAMRVRWGDTESGGSVTWAVGASGLDLTDYAFLSLRMGHIWNASPNSITSVTVGIRTPSGMGTQVFSVGVELYTQDDAPIDPLAMTPTAYVADFMRTMRIPLDAYCDQGADVTDVQEVVIEFATDSESRSVLIDSLEFVKATDTSESGQCL